METANLVTPKISVVLPALLGYESVRAALDAWEQQTRRDLIEVLVLCRDDPKPAEEGDWRSAPIVVPVGELRLEQARALGIRTARAEFVMIAEDHCVPEPDWVERMLPVMDEGWTAVGPALRPGDPETLCSQASFLLGYGQWMVPVRSGVVEFLPGHNVTVRRDVLLAWEAELEEELLVASFLIQRLRREHGRLYLNGEIRMWHFDPSNWRRTLRIFGYVGMGFGARRSRHWNPGQRLLYAACAPAIAAAHWWRAFRQFRRAGIEGGIRPGALAVASFLAMAWGCGEAAGALAGIDLVKPHIAGSEIKPVSQDLAAKAGIYRNSTVATRYQPRPLSSTPQNSKYCVPAGKRPDPRRSAESVPRGSMRPVPNQSGIAEE